MQHDSQPAPTATTATPPPPTPLAYDATADFVPRRRYRRLVWAVALTWVALAAIVLGPAALRVGRATWARLTAPPPPPPVAVRTVTVRVPTPVLANATTAASPAPWVLEQRRRESHQKALMTRSPNATFVTYEEEPIAARKLLSSGGATDYRMPTPYAQLPDAIRHSFQMPAMHPAPATNPEIRNEYHREAALFAGALTSPAGNRRYVVVELAVQIGGGVPHNDTQRPGGPRFEVTVGFRRKLRFQIHEPKSDGTFERIREGDSLSIRQPGGDMIGAAWIDGVLRAQRPRELNLRFYAGQVDPKDPSHVTIEYVLNGRRDTVDVHLADDDFLRIVPRSGKVEGGTWHIGETAAPGKK